MKKNFELRQVDKFKKLSLGQGVILGPGDDAAILESCGRDEELVFCGDMVIENVHFDRKQLSFEEIGRKAVARTLSDIAAMGAEALYMGFSLALPKSDRENVDSIMNGARSLLADFDCDLVGGDLSKAPIIICDTWCIGKVEKGQYLTRSGAKPGDAIFVSSALGGSYDSKRHANFVPQIDLARKLKAKHKINSMMDISDGLVFDLYRILEDSNKSAVLIADAIPVNDNCSLENALYDGEDYQLIFTADRQCSDSLLADDCHCVGYIEDGANELFLDNGQERVFLEREGFSSLS